MKKTAFLFLLCSLLLSSCSPSAAESLPADGTPPSATTQEDGAAEPEISCEHPTAGGDNIVEHEPVGYCGNTTTTVSYQPVGTGPDASWSFSFQGDDSVFLTDFLRHLDYSEGVCRCLPEYTVDTEFGEGYGINLSSGYARHDGGQVSLTAEQVETLRNLMDRISAQRDPK